MIRNFEPWDIDRIMEIWMESNLQVHHFIPCDYWSRKFNQVKEMIPKAEVYVFEEAEEDLFGFIGVIDNHIAGLFVDRARRGKGVGKQLLNWVKGKKEMLTLRVYRHNEEAFEFYRREGFDTTEVQVDSDTGQTELTMRWSRQ